MLRRGLFSMLSSVFDIDSLSSVSGNRSSNFGNLSSILGNLSSVWGNDSSAAKPLSVVSVPSSLLLSVVLGCSTCIVGTSGFLRHAQVCLLMTLSFFLRCWASCSFCLALATKSWYRSREMFSLLSMASCQTRPRIDGGSPLHHSSRVRLEFFLKRTNFSLIQRC